MSQRESGVFTAGPEHPGLKLPEMEALFRRRWVAPFFFLFSHNPGFCCIDAFVYRVWQVRPHITLTL